jgi:anti-sigma B factor antagonist
VTQFCPLPEGDDLCPGQVTIEVDMGPEAATILIRGELDLVTLPALAERLARLGQDQPERLVFDLAGTRFLDCGAARLIAGAGQWLPDGGRPVLRRPGPSVRRVLELTGLGVYCQVEE